MIYESKKKLKKYMHLIAALISYSIGYFTPLMALSAIEDHKKHYHFNNLSTLILDNVLS